MPTLTDLLLTACVAAGLAWLWIAAVALRGRRGLRTLEPLDQPPAGDVLAVVPCRDEPTGPLAETLRRLAAQRDVTLSIRVVDDRSRPSAAADLARLVNRHGATSIRVEPPLPAGWLGKCHACWQGATEPGGNRAPEWLLFVDADSHLEPDAVARAVRSAERSGADHLCLVPQLREQTAAGRAVSLAMCLGLVSQANGIEADAPRAYVGVGAFTLVRRAAYLAVDGHRRQRMEVVEDLRLARELRLSGHRTRLRFAVESFDVAWITNLRSAFTVLEKNYFAIFRFDLLRFLLAWGAGLGCWLAALAGPALALRAGPLALAPTFGLLTVAAASAPIATRYRWPRRYAFAVPITIGVVFAAMAYSTARTLLAGGVRWRDSFYPLQDLRRAARSPAPTRT